MTAFLRETIHAPRATTLMARHPGALLPERLERALEIVWDDLLARLEQPIVTTDTRAHRVAEFLGCVRYIRIKCSGRVKLTHLTRAAGQLSFIEADYGWNIDLPMSPNGAFLEHYLCRWWMVIGECLQDPDDRDGAEAFLLSFQSELWRSLRRSTWWQRLRYALREAIRPDPQILAWARAGRPRHDNRNLHAQDYNRTLRHRAQYAAVQKENPRLVWLLTFFLDAGLRVPKDQTIAWMKDEIESRNVTPACWRLLANGSEKDFHHIRDWIGQGNTLRQRVYELTAWLCCLVALRWKTPMAPAIRRLFMHDSFDTGEGRTLLFRNVRLSLPVVRILLVEAERRLLAGSLAQFVSDDLVEVLTWLDAEQPTLAGNQIKAGWRYLARRAAEWKVGVEAAAELGVLAWDSVLGVTHTDGWVVTPLTSVWQVRREALRQHHCADSYLAPCAAGTARLFSVANAAGKTVATIGIACEEDRWRSFGILAACNRPVTGTLVGLDEKIARRYTDVWRLAPPAQARRPDAAEPAAREDAERDAAALQHLEERLDMMIDREEPMLRAMIAMERDMMETMPDRRRSCDGGSA